MAPDQARAGGRPDLCARGHHAAGGLITPEAPAVALTRRLDGDATNVIGLPNYVREHQAGEQAA